MNKIVFKMDREGYRELMRSQEMCDLTKSYANEVLARCPSIGYSMNTMVGRNRVNTMVYPESDEAIADNYNHNTLLKAKGGGI